MEALTDIEASAAASAITTLAQRKVSEAARRRQAVAAALRAYACRGSGTFVVFGSYVTDTMRCDGDLDVPIDFPPAGSGGLVLRRGSVRIDSLPAP